MSDYPNRYFRLRLKNGFTDADIDAFNEGYRVWKSWVDESIRDWDSKEYNKGEPPPEFAASAPTLSADRTTLTIEITGEPKNWGHLKMYEDGVPWLFYAHFSPEAKSELEVSYENERLGFAGWYRVVRE